MKVDLAKATLSDARRRLIELMQNINFGRIAGLTVLDGNPVFDPPPRVVREIKFGGENGPRPELESGNFLLKAQIVEFFHHLDEVGNGIIEMLEVKHGLPFRMLVPEVIT